MIYCVRKNVTAMSATSMIVRKSVAFLACMSAFFASHHFAGRIPAIWKVMIPARLIQMIFAMNTSPAWSALV